MQGSRSPKAQKEAELKSARAEGASEEREKQLQKARNIVSNPSYINPDTGKLLTDEQAQDFSSTPGTGIGAQIGAGVRPAYGGGQNIFLN